MGLATQMMKEVADLIRLGFPESTATKIASGELPMDTASRMQRAEEQGYSPDVVYRGIGRDYDPDKAGHYQMFTSSSQDAAEYGDNVIEARLNLGDSIEVDGRGRNFNNIYVGDLPSNLFDRLHGSERESLIARTDDLAHAANKAGNDSLIIKNIYDKADNEIPKRPSPNTDSRMPDIELLRELGIEVDATPAKSGDSFVDTKNYDPVDVSVVFDPSRVRSVNAAFDPDYKGANLLGEYALPAGSTALMASLLAAPEEAEAGPLAKAISKTISRQALRDEANRLRFGDPDTSYRGDHRAPDADYGAPLHDLTQMIPDDIYSSQGRRLYGLGRSDVDDEAFDVLNAVRGQPDAEVIMYRAVPEDAPDSILDGDWVTTSEEYARLHGENALNNEYKILTEPTYARRLQSEGYPYEFGYMEKGSATPGMLALLGAGGAGATAAGSESNAVTEATSRIVNHMLDNVTEVTDLLEIPQRGIQGLLRAGYGLMQGDGLDASLNAGADVVNQGVEETAKQAGDAMLEKTGNPELATMAYTAVMLGSPI